MFEEKVLLPSHLPLPERNRKSTDIICTIIGAAFALTLFIAACVMWNKDKFDNHFYGRFSVSQNRSCASNQTFYFPDPRNINTSTCVSTCPLDYEATQGFCLPKQEKLLDSYLQNPQIREQVNHNPFKWVLFYSFIIAFSLGLLWTALVQLLPRIIPILTYLLAASSLIALGVLIIVLYDKYWNQIFWLKIFIPVVCFVLALILLVMVFLYSNSLKFQGLFLDYSTRFLARNPATFIYLPVFLIFLVGLVALIIWQHCCFTSQLASSKHFFNFTNAGVWQIFNILQFIWGVQFLRDAFNFCVSGHATDYYWRENEKPTCFSAYSRLICYHWGSVTGGSFLNAFFQLPTLLAELLTCHPTSCCHRLGSICYNDCNCLTCFFDLIRTDSYAYINIAGIPFCNASRQCKKICSNSKHFVGNYSPLKHYKFAAHVFLVSIAFLAAWFILRSRLWVYGFWNITLLVVVVYITVTFFIGIHADAAEGLQTSYLCEHQLQPNHTLLQKLHPAYVTELDHWQRRDVGDGNC